MPLGRTGYPDDLGRPLHGFQYGRYVSGTSLLVDGAQTLRLTSTSYTRHVCFGSKADIEARPFDVRFTPESGHR
jgi:hypothetical protein